MSTSFEKATWMIKEESKASGRILFKTRIIQERGEVRGDEYITMLEHNVANYEDSLKVDTQLKAIDMENSNSNTDEFFKNKYLAVGSYPPCKGTIVVSSTIESSEDPLILIKESKTPKKDLAASSSLDISKR
ncbi:hypothetical protein RND71_030762 [Anisodus tanguticus]|uniref:Uncharacterized protein n=1 Tax=Anisodus tanguticus TaxID=243964 RepID=A0AAE1RFU1_9SOLA|nr:hypothetical protein RND71_030762 [Anisodus tanguticus]